MGAALTIGRVAKLAGVNVETVRYYQRRGLVAEPDRDHGSYRRYPMRTVDRILFIKRAQALGFSLDEIAILMQSGPALECERVRELVAQKTEALRSQIDALGGRLDTLERLAYQCPKRLDADCAGCLLLGHLSGESVLADDAEVNCAMAE